MQKTNKIIILHGWTYSTEKWSHFINLLEKEGIQVELPFVPGLTVKTNKIWNIDNYVDWLKKIIDKNKEKIILIGHSNGGRIAAVFSAKYPEKVKNLVLIDSAGIYHHDFKIRFKRLVFEILAKLGRKITASVKLKDLLYWLVGESDYQSATSEMKKTMINLINFDLMPSLQKIKIPVFIVWGEKDKITPLSDGKIMQESIKDSNLYIVSSAGHIPQFTHTEEVVEQIIRKTIK